MRRTTALHLALLVVLPLLVFANTLRNAYHLDDFYRIVDNPELERVFPPWRHFADPRTSTTLETLAQYRPLLPLTLSVNHALSDALGVARLTGLHVGNLALHVATVVLLYLLFATLFGLGRAPPLPEAARPHAAFAGALLFALHPVAGVPVNYLCARDLLLMNLFLVAALLVYARMRRGPDRPLAWAAVVVLLALSICSKTNAIVAPALFLCFELLLARGSWLRALPAAAVSLGFVGLTEGVLGFSDRAQLRVGTGRLDYALTQVEVHTFHYLRNAVWPFRMRPLPDVAAGSLAAPQLWIGAAVIAGSLWLAWRWRRRLPLASFAILAYWSLFALTSSVLPLRSPATDYRQVPSLPWLTLLASVLLFARLPVPRAYPLVAALALYLGLSSRALNEVWSDERSLWEQSVRYGATEQAHVNYGRSLLGVDDAEAERHFRIAIDRYPGHVYARLNLGSLYVSRGRVDEGLAVLQEAVQLQPGWAISRFHLAEALGSLGRGADAAPVYARAADLDPRNAHYQYMAAWYAYDQEDYATSARYLERLHALVPSYRNSLWIEGYVRWRLGDEDGAIESLERFLVQEPDHPNARELLDQLR